MNENTSVKLGQLGFSDSEINKMANTFKNTLNLSPDKVEAVFYELINQGLSERMAHDFLIHTPSILGKAVNTIRKQFDLYKQIFGNKYVEVLNVNPRRLIQGYETTANRYSFFKEKNILPDEIERSIFIGKKQFKKKYGIEL